MKRLSQKIVQKIIVNWQDVQNPAVRAEYGKLQGWASIWVNLILAVIKGGIGMISGSIALMADALHSLSDIMTSIVIVVSFFLSEKPSDARHPYGHGRMESIATVIVAVLLMVAGVEILKGSFGRLMHPQPVQIGVGMIGLVFLTVIVKELLSRFSRELSVLTGSSALEADFWHHRSDVLSSLLVIAALIGQRAGLRYIDGAAGLLVAFFILYTGWRILIDSVDELLGRQPDAELAEQIKAAVRSVSDVQDTHDLIMHQYGQIIIVSLHIQICESHSLKQAHDISEQVEKKIQENFGAHATIHLDPVNMKDPALNEIRANLGKWLEPYNNQIVFHDVRFIESDGSQKQLAFDLQAAPSVPDDVVEQCRLELMESLQRHYSELKAVQIQVDPKFVL